MLLQWTEDVSLQWENEGGLRTLNLSKKAARKR